VKFEVKKSILGRVLYTAGFLASGPLKLINRRDSRDEQHGVPGIAGLYGDGNGDKQSPARPNVAKFVGNGPRNVKFDVKVDF
jgi:hypothetical protein